MYHLPPQAVNIDARKPSVDSNLRGYQITEDDQRYGLTPAQGLSHLPSSHPSSRLTSQYAGSLQDQRRDVPTVELDLSLNRMSFDSGASWRERLDKKHVLDVAVRSVRWTKSTGSHDITEETQKTKPMRLAINSSLLWHELSNITKQDINSDQNVLLPPWKSLIMYREEIDQRIATLEKIAADNHSEKAEHENPEVPSTKGADHFSEVDNLQYAASHLKCLQEFINVDLKETFNLRESLRAGTETSITFDDLWHLFNPGDVIISDNPQRAYKVFHVSGGRTCISKPKAFQKKPSVTAFRIDVFYIDFDLKTIGPIHETLYIFEYEGKRKVTSLPCYPLRYVENEMKTQKTLVDRGKRLREITPYSHKHYVGQSSGANPVQVSCDQHIQKNIKLTIPSSIVIS